MKGRWRADIVFFFLFVFCSNPSLAQDSHGPRMVLKEQIFDFQEVMEGEVIEHAFQVFNQGDQTLNIEKVKPG
ncbi:MAG: hypothetical protein SV775_06730 [Thermodesulfobacteriota bacterium]|nr:hypothetical protein [Thermodesulfobacteriota bacterium]